MKGISLIFTIIILSIALVVVLGLAQIFISGLISAQNTHLSTVAFYVADSGIEAALYADRYDVHNFGTGLPDGFVCNNETPRDDDTCLEDLDNGGSYIYEVTGDTPTRSVVAGGIYFGTRRSIEVTY
jgi:hypothetical protein